MSKYLCWYALAGVGAHDELNSRSALKKTLKHVASLPGLTSSFSSTVKQVKEWKESNDPLRQNPMPTPNIKLPPIVPSRENNGLGGVITRLNNNLKHCDPGVGGLCCYFPNFCHVWATCTSKPSPQNLFEIAEAVPRCACAAGFYGDGKTQGNGCTNINECASGAALCDQVCHDHVPGYACSCRDGFELSEDLVTCVDIDECTRGLHKCDQICENSPGSYSCACKGGYELDPTNSRKCFDIDECARANENSLPVCQFPDGCVNTAGSYTCSCPTGLQVAKNEKQTCEDVDECLTLKSPCPNGRTTNSHTGDIVQLNSIMSQLCENTYGGFTCSCRPGFRPIGSHNDSNIIPGGTTLAEVASAYVEMLAANARLHCADINECVEEQDVCGPPPPLGGVCVNTIGSYSCQCHEGEIFDESEKRCTLEKEPDDLSLDNIITREEQEVVVPVGDESCYPGLCSSSSPCCQVASHRVFCHPRRIVSRGFGLSRLFSNKLTYCPPGTQDVF